MKNINNVYWAIIPIFLILGSILAYEFKDERIAIGAVFLSTIIMFVISLLINKSENELEEKEYSVERISESYPKEKKRIQELMEEYSYFSIKHEKAISEPISISNVDYSKDAIEDFTWFREKLKNEKFDLNVTKKIYIGLFKLVESRLEQLEELSYDDRGLLGEIIEIEEEELNEEMLQILI